MPILTQYSIVCQVPGADTNTIRAYSGKDLSQITGITQVNLPEGHYGWIQICGEAFVKVSGQTKAAYVDFRPNSAKLNLREELSNGAQEQVAKGEGGENPLPHEAEERLSQLPPLLVEYGPYCELIREARDVFVDGHFYACVAMCGISLERFQRDKAKPLGTKQEHTMADVRNLLRKNRIISPATLRLCEKMADLRNEYAHGQGINPREDALKSLDWMHAFIYNETNLMRDYVIVDGILSRKRTKIII